MTLLPIRAVEKPWGCDVLPAPFASAEGKKIGEVWFEPPEQLPELLVKYIFTSENLSVQVHPCDAQTLAKGQGKQGKEECWLVIAAEQGARLGIGFDAAISAQAMRAAALDGSIEHLLTWHEVSAGDFFYIPANTVHAIGAGVSVIEVQQNSDITYRLYDYGRPRPLHLDDGIAVALGEVYDRTRWHQHLPAGGSVALVDGPYFRLERIAAGDQGDWRGRFDGASLLVVPLSGGVQVAGESVPAGSCALAAKVEQIVLKTDALMLVAQPLVR